jgi:mono/diheme cytochrome c family protein
MAIPRSLLTSVLVVPCLFAAIVAGCGDDDAVAPSNDGGADTSTPDTPDTSVPDTGVPVDAGPDGSAQLARGKYLVDHVAVCVDCHTPRTNTGAFDMTKYLAGIDCFIDVNGPAEGGCLNTANLTNDATGLANRTDAQIKTMLLDGVRPDGTFLSPVMPYWSYHNMTAADADAIVAYLRTVPAVSRVAPANDPPFADVPAAATPIDPTTIPAAVGGPGAENGRYLSAMVGVCLECHTAELPPNEPTPRDMTKPFGGGRGFPREAFGLPNPPFPDTIYTSNLTPHATGLADFSIADIQRVIQHGRDREDAGVCPPMPSGPMGPFAGLTEQDVLDIATYIKGLPPIDNEIPNGCAIP